MTGFYMRKTQIPTVARFDLALGARGFFKGAASFQSQLHPLKSHGARSFLSGFRSRFGLKYRK